MLTMTQEATAASTRRGGYDSPIAEHYYALAQWLRPAVARGAAGSNSKAVGVTSCTGGAGVSTVAANLAIATARSGPEPVLLVDLSGKPCSLAARLSLSGDLGLSRALADGVAAAECVRPAIENLSLLASGGSGASPLTSCDAARVVELLYELQQDFSLLVVDLPPTDSGLCFSTAGTLDGVLLVMDGQRTHSQLAARAKQRLAHANAAMLGVILNNHTRDLPQWLDARV